LNLFIDVESIDRASVRGRYVALLSDSVDEAPNFEGFVTKNGPKLFPPQGFVKLDA
jgi:hypothetical protein